MPRSPRRSEPAVSISPRALREFLATEAAAGALLGLATVLALVWANTPWQTSYDTLWNTRLAVGLGGSELDLDLRHWVNDGLMAIFFLVVGLEIKRELVVGELRDRRQAALPVLGAIGGMAVPALLYLALNHDGDAARGWGIPMATDIAFALGVIAVVGRSVPPAVRLFLLTLAIVDDLGAIAVIAVFYTSDLEVGWLAVALGVVVLVAVLRHVGIGATPVFGGLGIGLWLALHASGVHATLAGVAMALLVPAVPRESDGLSPLERLEHRLHGWSSFIIVPLFALANAGVPLGADAIGDAAGSRVTWGVVVGLVIGKVVGIAGASWLATRARLTTLPPGVTWRQLMGAAALGGVGFTVSLFVTTLAFDDAALVDEARIGILAASLVASIAGALLLRGHPGRDEARRSGGPAEWS